MNPKLVSIGDLNADLLASVDSLPQKGSEIQTSFFEVYPGGSAANTAVAAERLGIESGFVGRVGEDFFGRFLIKKFEEEGVDSREVQKGSEKGSGVMIVIVTPDGERTMICQRGANTNLDSSKIDRDYVKKADYFHVSGYALLEPPQSKAAKRLMDTADEGDLHISLDPGVLSLERYREKIISILPHIDTLFLNEVEIDLLLDSKERTKSEKKILEKGPSTLVIKLGENGSLVVTGNREFKIDSFSTEVKGTTGAGDAFDAAFLVGMDKGWDMEKSAKFANAVGALSGLELGARTSLPSFGEVRRFLSDKGVEI